ncbi:MAG: blue copper oxidase, partial [Candidatus Promineifilaceae bacterium]
MTHINRRQFLTIFASTLGATTLSSCMPNGGMGGSMLEPSSGLDPAKLTPVAEIPAVTVSSNTASSFNPDVEIVLRSFVDDYIFSDGDQTNMLRYAGELLTGQPENLTPMADSYLGPTIRLKKGQKVRIHLQNQLPFPTIAHWHGQHLPEEMDGHPLYSIESGETYVYEFEVNNRAGTYWYHPHPHGHTGAQVYFGLAGLFIIEDEEEQAYDLPRGEFDVPVVIQDRTFKDDGELQYIDNGHQVMAGFWANSLMINGRRDFLQKVSTQPYRIRLLNGSNARIYKLAWDDDTPVTVIGTDGGLLGAPVTREYVMLAPAERLELWVDFAGLDNGSKKSILALPFTGGNESVIEL